MVTRILHKCLQIAILFSAFILMPPLACAELIIRDIPLNRLPEWKKRELLIINNRHEEVTPLTVLNTVQLNTGLWAKNSLRVRLPAGEIPPEWLSIIQQASKLYNVPEALIAAVIRVESNFNAKAVSPMGARGAMQIMPSTGSYLGLSNFFDAAANVNAGTEYLAQLLQEFPGLHLALAAYNAGPQRVRDFKGVPPYKETQNYVRSVLEFYEDYRRHR